ncbi:MAG: transposase, partial [Cyanobacteria bacterium J06553_1]
MPRIYGFSAVPGIQEDLEPDATPRDVFQLFFTPALWTTMRDETNRYRSQHPRETSSHMAAWKDVTVEELQCYMGLRILMGIHNLPEIRHYWSGNRLLGVPVFQEYMTRDRFDLITSCLHFTDNNDARRGEDRLWKLRTVVDCLQKAFKEVYVPEREVSVDESLFRYKGRHHAIQFCPAKRARFGLKVYKLCASSGPMSGYTSAFKVYMGQDRSEVPASMKAVIDLMDAASLFDKGYTVYTDNWYSSPTLFHYLQGRRTNAVGTVRTTRKHMPADLKVETKGEVVVRSSKTGQCAVAWKDKKQVTLLSTIHRGGEKVTLPPNYRGEERTKPLVVHNYNQFMNGVDLSDQLASFYHTPRKCKKWYHNLYFHLVDTALVNAHLVYQQNGGRMAPLDFRLALVEEYLVTPLPPRPQRRGRSSTPRRAPVPEGHHLVSTRNYRRC